MVVGIGCAFSHRESEPIKCLIMSRPNNLQMLTSDASLFADITGLFVTYMKIKSLKEK